MEKQEAKRGEKVEKHPSVRETKRETVEKWEVGLGSEGNRAIVERSDQ